MEKLTEENWEVLNRLGTDSLREIHDDAILAIDTQVETERIINEKAGHLFNLLVAVSVTLIGYWTSDVTKIRTEPLFFQVSAILVLAMGISLLLLYRIIYPSLSYSKGFVPDIMAQKDIFISADTDMQRHLMNKISSMNRGININRENNRRKSRLLKLAVKIMLSSLLIIILYAIGFYFLTLPD
ncbi:hypothetical protein ASG38_15035 [Flavobacterium sp. Leaf359]|uniref:hypothetical protein n=1 Tax=Flavobacterium sp. Leaf359 TaxID=1736351 RepID=UPI0006FE72F4|nr:hypothetical protein [Flavobacterium sp. Leaf359]KQS45922.1 hypothetical protein ASG38_15035 [Flavobacterium sp. Leaf359]